MGRLNALMQHVRRRVWFRLNFYRVHVLYFLLTIIIASIIMYGSGINGNSDNAEALFKLRYIDAIIRCASAMTAAGLNSVNLSYLTAFQQSILFILTLLGNVTFVSNAAVWIRWYYLRKHWKDVLKHSKTARERILHEIEREENGEKPSLTNGASESISSAISQRPRGETQSSRIRNRRSHHEIGHGGIPYPWEWEISRKLKAKLATATKPIHKRTHHHLSFRPSLDQKVSSPTLVCNLILTRSRVVSTPSKNTRRRSLVA